MEHRERVQVDVAVGDADVPPERRRVEPGVAVGDLDTLGPGGGARGVVDVGRGLLVGVPALGLGLVRRLGEQPHVGPPVEQDAVLGLHADQCLVEVGVDEQHRRAAMLDDVAHLLGREAKVDRHHGAAEAADAPEGDQQATGVGADDRHPLPLTHTHGLEPERHPPGPPVELSVGEAAERAGRAGLVDQSHPVGIHVSGAREEITNGQCDVHAEQRSPRVWDTRQKLTVSSERGSAIGVSH
jgi:hypothetical protein